MLPRVCSVPLRRRTDHVFSSAARLPTAFAQQASLAPSRPTCRGKSAARHHIEEMRREAANEIVYAEGCQRRFSHPREDGQTAGIVHRGRGKLPTPRSAFGVLGSLGALHLETGSMCNAKRLLEEAPRGELAAKAVCALGHCYEVPRSLKRARTYYKRALAEAEPYAAACLSDMRVCTSRAVASPKFAIPLAPEVLRTETGLPLRRR